MESGAGRMIAKVACRMKDSSTMRAEMSSLVGTGVRWSFAMLFWEWVKVDKGRPWAGPQRERFRASRTW